MPGMTTASRPYYTQCPGCATLFRVDVLPERARCGACGCRFHPPRRHAQHLPLVFKPFVPEAFRLAALPVPSSPQLAEIEPARPLPPIAQRADAEASATPGPSLRPRRGAAGPAWLLAGLLLSVVLLGQLLLLQRDSLADHRPLRPVLTMLCELAACTLRPLRDLDAWRLSDAELIPDPERPGMLLATGQLRHAADQRLELPLLQIEILDAGGGVARQGVFAADTYLEADAASLDWAPGLAPGESVAIAFRLEEPGLSPDQFRFRLRSN